jgi:hypothetical protein
VFLSATISGATPPTIAPVRTAIRTNRNDIGLVETCLLATMELHLVRG